MLSQKYILEFKKMEKNTSAANWVETGYEDNSFQSHSQTLQIATLKHAMHVMCVNYQNTPYPGLPRTVTVVSKFLLAQLIL